MRPRFAKCRRAADDCNFVDIITASYANPARVVVTWQQDVALSFK